MWIAVYIARNKPTADRIVQTLSDEGFMVRLRPVYRSVSLDGNCYEVLVLKSEVRDVQSTLMENDYWGWK